MYGNFDGARFALETAALIVFFGLLCAALYVVGGIVTA